MPRGQHDEPCRGCSRLSSCPFIVAGPHFLAGVYEVTCLSIAVAGLWQLRVARASAGALLLPSCSGSSLLQIHAEKSPYLTEKLRIFMLPTLALVKNQKVDSYVVGFDELGGKDDFSTEVLAGRLEQAALLWPSGGLDGVALQHKSSEGDRLQQPMGTLQYTGGV